jgi:hypothetical protein
LSYYDGDELLCTGPGFKFERNLSRKSTIRPILVQHDLATLCALARFRMHEQSRAAVAKAPCTVKFESIFRFWSVGMQREKLSGLGDALGRGNKIPRLHVLYVSIGKKPEKTRRAKKSGVHHKGAADSCIGFVVCGVDEQAGLYVLKIHVRLFSSAGVCFKSDDSVNGIAERERRWGVSN